MSAVDVMVVGAGPAGLAFATAAIAGGMRVGIAEGRGQRKVGEVVAARARVPLEAIGAWKTFLESAVPIDEAISLWSNGKALSQSSVFSPYGAMWGVDRDRLEARLLDNVVRGGAARIGHARVERAKDDRSWRASCSKTGATLSSPLLVVATGRGAFPWPNGAHREDRLAALVSYQFKGPSAAFVIETCQEGWWYTAPLPSGCRVVALMADADLLPKGRHAMEAFWRNSLVATKAIREHAGIDTGGAELIIRASGGSRRRTIWGRNWLALGDAASTFDPLCGQGIESALTKGLVAGKILSREGPTTRTWREFVQADRKTFLDYKRALSETYNEATVDRTRSPFWQRRQARGSG